MNCLKAAYVKVKAFCLNSLTIAWGYLMAFGGLFLASVDAIGDALGDPNLRDQISSAIGDAKTAARVLLVASLATIVARLRSLRKDPQ